ncbi:ABC transporter permease [Fusibacter sp. JL216-2]|uniref:ABC transporter permease n=1 Tax=Fusibacter sp. JL216-2 TaxID=3071453 RepID=UPI003D33294B
MLAVIKLRLLGLKEDYKIMLVMAVLALGMVYAFSAGGGTYERVVHITDMDQSEVSKQFIRELSQEKEYKVNVIGEKEGRQAIADGEGLAHIILPKDFERSLSRNDLALAFISSKNDVDTMGLKNTVRGILTNLHANLIFSQKTASQIGSIKENIDEEKLSQALYEKIEKRYKLQNPYTISEKSLSGGWSRQDQILHNFIGFALLFSAYSIVFGIGEILNDKAYHTWDRLLQTPVSIGKILLGNTFTTLLVGFIQMAIIFIGGQVLFGIEIGDHLVLVLITGFAYIFSLTGLGLFLASILKNHSQLSAVTPILLTSFAMLGGCMWPLEIVTSKILLGLSFITPHRWAFEALESIMIRNLGFNDIVMPLSILIIMGLALIAGGGYMVGKAQAR